jgi:hypothetical protein
VPEPIHDIDRDAAFLERLVHEVDPTVHVTISPYVWNDEDVLDVALDKEGLERHYEISAARCESLLHVPEILRHDFEALLGDLERALGHPAPRPHGTVRY